MSNMLEYNGYHAKIEFDEEDMLMVGEVFGINDSLNFYGRTIDEVVEMFHQSIDNYLELCKEIGKTTDKEYKGSFNVRMSPDLHRASALEAEKRGVSLNKFIEDAARNELNRDKQTEKIIMAMPMEYVRRYAQTTIGDLSIFDETEMMVR